jgi:hypothetical protein
MAAPFEMAWIVLKDHQFDAAARARPLPDHPDSPEHGGYYDIEEEEPEEEDSRHLPLEDELDPMRVHQEEQAAHRQVSEGLPDPSQQGPADNLSPEDVSMGGPPHPGAHLPQNRPEPSQAPPNPFQQAMSHLSERSGNSVTPDHWKS